MPRNPGSWWAFRTGLSRSLQHWPLMLLFYAVLLLLAGLLLAPVARFLSQWIGYRTAAWELADGLDGWLAAEMLWSLQDRATLDVLDRVRPFLLPALPAWTFVLSTPFVLLSGGVLSLYSKQRQRGFWRQVAHYAGSFLALLVVEIVLLEGSVFLLLYISLQAILLPAGPTATLARVLLIVLLPCALAAVVVLVPWWFEYARVMAVTRQDRHVLRSLGRAALFLRDNLGPAAALAVLHFFLTLLPYLPYYLLTRIVPGSWWVGYVVVQQVLILALVGTRLARMAGQVRLVQARCMVAERSAGEQGPAYASPT